MAHALALFRPQAKQLWSVVSDRRQIGSVLTTGIWPLATAFYSLNSFSHIPIEPNPGANRHFPISKRPQPFVRADVSN